MRWKITLNTGKVVYTYGPEATWPKLPALIADMEHAGHYDRETNLVHFTEPTSIQDGPTFAEKQKVAS